jgi:hypothetical protein
MNEPSELEFLWWHMRGDFGWLMATISWITALRLGLKPINKFMESYIASRPTAQTRWAQVILGSAAWGFVVFLVDYLASVKLPNGKTSGANMASIQNPPAS